MKFIDPAKSYPPGWVDPETKRMDYEPSPMQDCYRALEDLVDAGLIRNIGISNFNVQLILDVLTYAKYKPAVLQSKFISNGSMFVPWFTHTSSLILYVFFISRATPLSAAVASRRMDAKARHPRYRLFVLWSCRV